ncbi:MAG TPA: Rpn family recombination-promoting nuclease/putative transposase [Puia sp.]|nr:Rpn family recombination-promoting nuclease/putative transposase [Puia sp.]
MASENDLILEDKQGSRQINQYDKVLRENIEAALPGLIKNLLHIHAADTEELPDDIQHTKERKPDVLKKVTDKNNATFVLHIELQVKDEPDMVFRMAEYFIMLYRRYRLPVRQYVIYIGEGSPGMADHFHSNQMDFKYQLIVFSTVDYHLLLHAENPEEKILAILANLGEEDPARAVENIVKQVVIASEGDFSTQRHIQQLRILAQLRNFTQENLEIMDNLAGYFTKEKDILYRLGEREGIEKGEEKKSYEVVKNLLVANKFTVAEIAKLADVTESFVKKVKKSLN